MHVIVSIQQQIWELECDLHLLSQRLTALALGAWRLALICLGASNVRQLQFVESVDTWV
jgi:hypothetical protein